MSLQSIDATFFASSHPNIAKRLSASVLLFSGIIFLAGLLILLSTFNMGESSSVLNLCLRVLASLLIMLSIFRIFSKPKEVFYVPTGSVVTEQSLFFDLKHLDELKECVSSGSFPPRGGLKGEENGNIRMDIIISHDKKFAAVQLFQFVPYAYNPISAVQYYTNDEASSLASFMNVSRAYE